MEKVIIKLDQATLPENGRYVSFGLSFVDGVIEKGIYRSITDVFIVSEKELYDAKTEVDWWVYEDDPKVQKEIDKRIAKLDRQIRLTQIMHQWEITKPD